MVFGFFFEGGRVLYLGLRVFIDLGLIKHGPFWVYNYLDLQDIFFFPFGTS